MREQVLHRLPVDLHEFQVDVFAGEQVLGENAHPGTDFQYGGIGFPRTPCGLKPLSDFLRKSRGRPAG